MSISQKKVAILGSTGSIGTSTLKVIRDFPGRFRVAALAAYGNASLLLKQAEEFLPDYVYMADEKKRKVLKSGLASAQCNICSGPDGMEEMLSLSQPDIVVVATVGFTGVKPVLWALKNQVPVALANKEVLVAAGDLVLEMQEKYKTPIYPVDSEHSAVFQCLEGQRKHLRKIILTASGGPFYNKSCREIQKATVKEVLNHPTWNMGRKITVDSATMINKGFEVIEAHYLFHLPPSQIQVVIHPQSIIHSMIELVDNTVIAQLSPTDMYYPILYALSFPERYEVKNKNNIDFYDLPPLTFARPDMKTFPCLRFAYDCLEKKRGLPVAFNAANEMVVAAFLQGQISFGCIPRLISKILEEFSPVDVSKFDIIVEIDREIRRKTAALIKQS